MSTFSEDTYPCIDFAAVWLIDCVCLCVCLCHVSLKYSYLTQITSHLHQTFRIGSWLSPKVILTFRGLAHVHMHTQHVKTWCNFWYIKNPYISAKWIKVFTKFLGLVPEDSSRQLWLPALGQRPTVMSRRPDSDLFNCAEFKDSEENKSNSEGYSEFECWGDSHADRSHALHRGNDFLPHSDQKF